MTETRGGISVIVAAAMTSNHTSGGIPKNDMSANRAVPTRLPMRSKR